MKLVNGSILAVLALLLSTMAQAEQFKTLGQWDVHYIVVPSTFVQPDIAKIYRFKRSKYQAIVNISVLNQADQRAQSVAVKGSATDLLGRVQPLSFREIREGDAIYYLASLKNDSSQVWRFHIDIGRGAERQELTFQEKVWVE